MRKLLQLFGFYGDEYEDEDGGYSDYDEEPQAARKSPAGRKNAKDPKNEPRAKHASPKLIFFQGIPPETVKLRLRDFLLEGAMVLLDIHDLEAEYVEEGRNFIYFMQGVAFAHKGESREIGPDLYVITPREGMLQCWGEEE